MKFIMKVLSNFWFCLSMAVLSLFFVLGHIDAGTYPWLSVVGGVCWIYLAWRTTQQPTLEDDALTPEQVKRITAATRTFRKEIDKVLKEAADNKTEEKDDE